MKTYFDLVQDLDFRNLVEKKLSIETRALYKIPSTLPMLYRYRPLNEFSIGDIINDKITFTSIGEFNDAFDGAIHQYGTKEDIEKAAEEKWKELDEAIKATGLPNTCLKPDDVIVLYRDYYKDESRLSFWKLDYLGTYVCCFSTDNASTLMWSHYADSNRGICAEYDFNTTESFRQMIFPVAYSHKPIDVSDLLNDEKRQICPYPLDVAVLCSALNKASVWSYENEWRLVLFLPFMKKKERRIDSAPLIKPTKVFLGYHFLKSFFYYDDKNADEIALASKQINDFIRLMAHLENNDIPVAVMTPAIGSYRFIPRKISVDDLLSLIRYKFRNNKPQNMRFYYTVHNQLMDKLDN